MQYSFNSRPYFSCIPEDFVFHNFLQHNYASNCRDSVLDLVFSNLDNLVFEPALEPLVPLNSYHPALSIYFSIVAPVLSVDYSRESYQFHRGRYNEMNDYLSFFNWKSIFYCLDLNTAVNTFFDALHFTVLTYVPKLRFTKSCFPSWVTKEVKNLVFEKKRAHAFFKSTKSLIHNREFSLLRARCKYETKKCFRRFGSDSETLLLKDPERFWDYVRKYRSAKSIPKTVYYNNLPGSSEHETTDLCSAYFKSVYTVKRNNVYLSGLNIPQFDF